jgi:hypothetical protein
VACPFFEPIEPLGREQWLHAPRFPLGECYRGLCRAASEPFEPPESAQDELCNCGYARGRCDRFPLESADAVRFSVASEDDERLRIIYIFERRHAPETHGVIEYSKALARLESELDQHLFALAIAFVRSYLRNSGL